MTTSLLIPLEGFHHVGTHSGGPPPFVPMIGASMFFLFLLLLVGSFFLVRRGKFGPPPWINRPPSAESEARRILAERFARSDISTEEFMERASILNWTPGSEPPPPYRKPKKR